MIDEGDRTAAIGDEEPFDTFGVHLGADFEVGRHTLPREGSVAEGPPCAGVTGHQDAVTRQQIGGKRGLAPRCSNASRDFCRDSCRAF